MSINTEIVRGDFNMALRLIHRTVDQINCEPINTATIYGSKALDDACQKVGAIHLRSIRDDLKADHPPGSPDNVVVYVASRLHASGGHSAVLSDIIRLSPPARSIILLTGTVGPTDRAAIRHYLNGMPEPSIEMAPRGSHIEKVDWLQRKIWVHAPNTVWLFNHHQDSVAIAAVQPDAGYRLRFYHHADHHLSLGVFLEYADHIDMNPLGFHNCRYELGISTNRYLPLTVKDFGENPANVNPISETGMITCTAAGFNKLSPPYFIHYVDVIPELLRVTKGKHIHIGPLGGLNLYRIRHRLRKLGVSGDRFVYIPFVKSVWRALHTYEVKLYIASFPYGGARTLIEAMGAGVAIAVHLHASSRLLSTIDIAFDGALSWRTPEELYKLVQHIDDAALNLLGQAGRMKYSSCYREEILAGALADWKLKVQLPSLNSGFKVDELQQALDIATQVSFRGVLSRIFNRTAQRLKSMRS
jgi:hypothetical protein